MSKIKLIIVTLILSLTSVAQAQQLDSAVCAALDVKLSEYVAAIETAGTDVQKEECDFIIGSVSDPSIRQYVATKLYNHYFSSKVMGSEAVAIHILDNWFFNGKIDMPDELSPFDARVFAEFNRQSLIGCIAPELYVETLDGEYLELFKNPPKRYSVLYFYSAECATCKMESILLRALLEDEEYPLDLYAFYVGDNKEDWSQYVKERFDISSQSVKVTHLWDPELQSDFQRKYGVIQTPRLYLVGPTGKIQGRGLDVYSLSQLLAALFTEVELEYGSDESMAFLSGMFEGERTSAQQVKDVADMVAMSTIQKGDTLMFRQITGDMLYYLSSERGEGYKEGLSYVIDEYILNPELKVWKSEDDSLKVIGYARMIDDFLSKSVPGSRISDIKVRGTLIAKGKSSEKTLSLRKIRGKENIIIFHTEGCGVCEAEIKKARELAVKGSKYKVFLVNVDDVLVESPALASRLFDSFDLSSLPFIVITDRKGEILSRYATLLWRTL